MNYSIKEVSEITGLPASTLRYYEKEKLLPGIMRNDSGIRIYTQEDLDWLSVISCLKDTDMSIKYIKKFVCLCALGDSSLEERRQLLLNHRETVQSRIAELQHHLEHINHKVNYYETACQKSKETELKEVSLEKDINL
ncbi:MerR family transcriptional regulator [Clostridium grantii]|uniref:DNA-binding transcriptional regulator, MerR family n=1 Tax=Clostridium grantii DSM 8605 TaxID=1121316 RepID=A0A1M5WFQ7_9CLOT|nr:MerR family transcriptional regulator [Clostridium grantii]SHH86331.1 DNA-binding transcriptional regulator, MerR family [Clostridium grantii DSM 8605]